MRGINSFTEPALKAVFADDFKIGAAVNPQTIQSQEQLLAYHFNSITAENEMKFESLHPLEGIYNFGKADELAAFARKHGLAMRGHTLVWHNQTSDWLFADEAGGPVSKELLLARSNAIRSILC